MLLGDDHRAVRDAVRQYVQPEIAPPRRGLGQSHQFPRRSLKGLADLGCWRGGARR